VWENWARRGESRPVDRKNGSDTFCKENKNPHRGTNLRKRKKKRSRKGEGNRFTRWETAGSKGGGHPSSFFKKYTSKRRTSVGATSKKNGKVDPKGKREGAGPECFPNDSNYLED